jgi:hypothetical protein
MNDAIAGNAPMRQRIQSILTNLEVVGEDLLALSDDIWLNIDHNDSAAVEKGAAFKIAFNKAIGEYREISARLSHLFEDFTQVPTFEAPSAPESDAERERRERSIRSLDRSVPHGLGEDFRYKRPAIFTLNGVPFDGTNTWSQVYETLCRYLALLNPAVFEALPTNPDFVSSKGNKYFSRQPSDLRLPRDYGRGVLAETNLSANQIRDNIKRLLSAFGLREKAFTVYLREDRDAGHAGETA